MIKKIINGAAINSLFQYAQRKAATNIVNSYEIFNGAAVKSLL